MWLFRHIVLIIQSKETNIYNNLTNTRYIRRLEIIIYFLWLEIQSISVLFAAFDPSLHKVIYYSPYRESFAFMKYDMISMGNGNTIVEFFSVDIVLSVYEQKKQQSKFHSSFTYAGNKVLWKITMMHMLRTLHSIWY